MSVDELATTTADPAPAWLARPTAALFGWAARRRGTSPLHPLGVSLLGSARVHGGAPGFDRADGVPVSVRVSRGIGLPHPLPDFNGLAVRFEDLLGPGDHQDLLLTTAGALPLLRQVLRPWPGLGGSGFSTLFPHRDLEGRRVLFRCEPFAVPSLGAVATSLPLQLSLRWARALGPWHPLAQVTLTEVVPEASRTRFDPWNTGPGLVPSGLLNRLRPPAYAASRAAVPEGVHP